ncbi:ABC transporter ATP-binding protein [Salinarimonas ramus]|uniref:Multidrug ABC transporter ATP-binding protein n=1 Tax=Salinarimonas ramus TaxID=690164 RepID=A0A917Q5R8_9HYPH|nr:ABC transporter ATP-binding protein [Salinarimonas ramus]GGK19288.1 multidrug ABC transporter ATP-binding protein [Salinarimonas ramus]
MSLRSERRGDPLRDIARFVGGHWRRRAKATLLIVGMMILSTLAEIAVPYYAGRIIDAVAAGPQAPGAGRAALVALLVTIGLGILSVAFRHKAFRGLERLTIFVMSDVAQESFARVQRFSSDWHASNFAGSTVRKITRGIWALDTFSDTVLVALLPSAVVLVGTIVLMSTQWPAMGAVVLVGAIAYVATVVAMSSRWVAPRARLANKQDTAMGGLLADAIGCNAVVKAFGAEAREDARFAKLLDKWRLRTQGAWLRYSTTWSTQLAILVVLRAVVLGLALWLWWRGQASAGDIAYVLTAFLVVNGYLREVGMHLNNLRQSVNEMEELVAIMEAPIGVLDRPDARPIAIARGEIAFERVTFHYKGHDAPLFRDLDVRIRAGERVGLVGRSGSGKSTFVKLIQRLHDVEAGRIAIDGQDVAAATQASLRQQIAIVPQEPILFHRTLAENIAYAKPGARMEEIEAAARLANAHDFITRLPKGYGTHVGERGVKLSGGERQRVALARAFLADAPILILDEATSSLDSESERLIQEAMERLMAGRTAIVIAHRLSTVRTLDRILVFDRGRIVEEGPHATLLGLPDGAYRRLFEAQAEDMGRAA